MSSNADLRESVTILGCERYLQGHAEHRRSHRFSGGKV